MVQDRFSEKSKQTLKISFFFGNYEILKKSAKLQRNFYDKKSSEIHKKLPGKRTRPKDVVSNIRNGL